MNEELEKIDTTVREPPKKAKEPKQKAKLTHQLWAKILAFVLLGLFLALLVAGIAECMFSYTAYMYWENVTEFIRDILIKGPGYSELTQAESLYAQQILGLVYDWSNWWLPMVLVGAVGTLACLVFAFVSAGRRKGREGASLNAVDRLPLDLYAAICWAAVFGLLLAVVAVADNMTDNTWPFLVTRNGVMFAVTVAICAYTGILIALAPFLSFATRLKVGGGIWWRNTLICWVCRLCWRFVKWCWSLVKRFCGWVWYMTKKIPIVPRTAIIMAAILFFNFLLMVWNMNVYGDAFVWFLLFILSLVIFVAACFGAWQMKSLKAAGERMAKGNIDEKIDTKYMYWEFKNHAKNLNSIGDGMAAAVEQRMKSERLKTELITNVSHDIKTPLTSIVNYVDLLQKPHTPEQEAEYLEVLDRQSKRLKKLTEDLVEASKASTGNMNVNIVRTNTREIIEQSLAEYGRRMEQGNLSVIVKISEEPPQAMADGRLLWRVLDNLFNNVVKYALPGTRVYITSELDGGDAVISVKNISRDPLNISAEELMERFVRGDASRHTEGSGLGLNIAQSLVNLMRGKFSISVDGDLFKAEIRLPKA
ncbi:MAG TPA: HAMP domain-containing histidine kinase [Candidatus Scatomorpha gallistercoris]|nr:HAMP domain-containing histidine kinase [Candidatus Scatomorpha gallistercoris]